MELEFDVVTVDTSLAEDYLQKSKLCEVYEAVGSHNTYFDGENFVNNVEDTEYNMSPASRDEDSVKDIDLKLIDLADQLKRNIKLFAQLDYLSRKIPLEDTETQVHIIIQQMHHMSQQCDITLTGVEVVAWRALGAASPLLALGHAARLLLLAGRCGLRAARLAAPVCHLFAALCRRAGLNVTVHFVEELDQPADDEVPAGAVGVVCGLADVESAADALRASSSHVPWKLRRVLVQENVFEQFKRAVARRGPPGVAGRAFYAEGDGEERTGGEAGEAERVPVEAYRSDKEALALLRRLAPHYVSLWAADVARVNLFAHGLAAPVVWVNGYGVFGGPPELSEAIYSGAAPLRPVAVRLDAGAAAELRALRERWLRLDAAERRARLGAALAGAAGEGAGRAARRARAPGAALQAGARGVALGVEAPSAAVFALERGAAWELAAPLLGGAALVAGAPLAAAAAALREAGAPVLSAAAGGGEPALLRRYERTGAAGFDVARTLRVIWTSSETIFAN
ncbi:uncharacterized protein LOC142977356 [Anticarsia gemmatalis]|uniref:uncharacterized protein LOC142977356 n=1 Tax=Anticarsia gemmatalis TaxID=129554 RepID=UPI003F765C04